MTATFKHPPVQRPRAPQRRVLLGCAAVVGVSLMSAYVQLLHGSVARGDLMRADQREATAQRLARPWNTAQPAVAK